MRASVGSKKRERLRQEFWPNEDVWTLTNEVGWFRAPRTLPIILQLFSLKEIGSSINPSNVYLELLARHIDGGLVEMVSETEHAAVAGYTGSRGIRSWQERMQMLETLGFIKTTALNHQKYKYVLIIHPTVVMHQLHEQGKVPEDLWRAFRARQIETKELSFTEREESKRLGRFRITHGRE